MIKIRKNNWSDFENTIKDIIKSEYENKEEMFSNKQYIDALAELQLYFSDFLNTLVTTEVLSSVDKLGDRIDFRIWYKRKLYHYILCNFFLCDLSKKELSRIDFAKSKTS